MSFHVERLDDWFVLRDDLYPGGTKARALKRCLPDWPEEFVYPSPAYGYAQVALASAASELGKRSRVFVAKRKVLHARTAEAKALGATVEECPYGYLSVVKKRARDYVAERPEAELLPWGFDFEAYRVSLQQVLCDLEGDFEEVWCVAGSGVLAGALRLRFPGAKLCVVRTGAKTELPFAQAVFDAPEKFQQDAKLPPPFPSCSNYDAKLWRFFKERASKGSLYWNVA